VAGTTLSGRRYDLPGPDTSSVICR
jgi:hypothetical protein